MYTRCSQWHHFKQQEEYKPSTCPKGEAEFSQYRMTVSLLLVKCVFHLKVYCFVFLTCYSVILVSHLPETILLPFVSLIDQR